MIPLVSLLLSLSEQKPEYKNYGKPDLIETKKPHQLPVKNGKIYFKK